MGKPISKPIFAYNSHRSIALPCYSARSAIAGSVRIARRAGR